MNRYRVALIGLGGIADQHREVLADLPDRCEIIGMHDIDPATLDARHETWGYRAFSSLADLLAAGPNVCWVMTPVGPRAEILSRCFDAGCHVFTEKPLALNVDEAEHMVRMARDAGRVIGFGCNERNLAPSYTMAQLYFSGALGRLVKAYAQTHIRRTEEFWESKLGRPDAWRLSFEASGGRIFEFAIHLVNWVQWIGGDPLWVAGTGDAVSRTLADNGLDDVVSALIKFEQGYAVVETIMAPGLSAPHRRRMGIIGTKGECWLDEDSQMIRVVIPEEGRDESLSPMDCPSKAEALFDALDRGKAPANDGAAALATTRICCAFNDSVRTNQTVVLRGPGEENQR